MPTRRQQRMNELLREELSLLIPGRLDDPRVAQASVTRVETTQDLSTAKVWVTDGNDDDVSAAHMLAGLDHAQGQLRVELGALGLPRLPRLVFARDKQFESGERVIALLDQIHVDDPADAADEPDAADSTSAPGSASPRA